MTRTSNAVITGITTAKATVAAVITARDTGAGIVTAISSRKAEITETDDGPDDSFIIPGEEVR